MKGLKGLTKGQVLLLIAGALLLLWSGQELWFYFDRQQAMLTDIGARYASDPAMVSDLRQMVQRDLLGAGAKALLGAGLLGGVFLKNELDARG